MLSSSPRQSCEWWSPCRLLSFLRLKSSIVPRLDASHALTTLSLEVQRRQPRLHFLERLQEVGLGCSLAQLLESRPCPEGLRDIRKERGTYWDFS